MISTTETAAAATAAAAAATAAAVQISRAALTDRGGGRENQDTVFTTVTDRTITVGVFDGHGTHGTLAATTAAETAAAAAAALQPLPAGFAAAEELFRTRLFETDRGKHVIRYGAVYNALTAAPVRGGTTASVLQVDQTTGAASFAHVGDSEARYWDCDPAAAPATTPAPAAAAAPAEGIPLTANHNPGSLSEFNRIRATNPAAPRQFLYAARNPQRPAFITDASGEWITNPAGGFSYCDVRNSWSIYFHSSEDEERLAMTRAIGDYHIKRDGLSAIPDCTTVPPPPPGTTRAYLVATDGFWDGMEYADVGAILCRPDLVGNAEVAAAALMGLGTLTNRQKFGYDHDNLSVAVVYVTSPSAAAPAAAP
jgi:serine/threonine protein phosphatase PrpC